MGRIGEGSGENEAPAQRHLHAARDALVHASAHLHEQWGRFCGGQAPAFNHLDLMGAVDTAEQRVSDALLALSASSRSTE